MSEAHDAFSTIIHVVASGVIHGGHGVTGTAAAATEATSVSFGALAQTEDCAIADIIPVCVLGPCKVWADGTTPIVVGDFVAVDGSGHYVKQASASTAVSGMALEALASGLAYIEVLIAPSQG